jgi:uncharacterized protein (DUF1015 family)
MAEVIPFRGILYNCERVKGSEVMAPPYDIITPELRERLYRKSPYNIVRIDAGEERPSDNDSDNKYTRAEAFLNKWLDEGILKRSAIPCFYAYEMEYRLSGETKRLRGFFGLVRLEELGKGVYPHECTHSKPKADRLRLMMTCLANTSPIFSLYHSEEKIASSIVNEVCKMTPYIEAIEDDVAHRLWIIEDSRYIKGIRDDLTNRPILIADGHHRYETALEFQRIMRERVGVARGDEPFNYVLMFLANISDGDITILPSHRLIHYEAEGLLDRLKEHFFIDKIPIKDDIIRTMKGKESTIGLMLRGKDHGYLLRFKGGDMEDVHTVLRGLDVVILHEFIFKRLLGVSDIHYEMDYRTSMSLLSRGEYDAAFFLNPTKVEDVERVALSSMRMPPKSTYFYPKVMTGFVINSLKN